MHPPGGFQFVQPQTGWEAPRGIPFASVVDAIVAHRRANPRFGLTTDPAAVERELDEFNCARLRGMPGGDSYIMADNPGVGPPPKYRPRPSSPTPRRSLGGDAVAGAKTVITNTKRAVAGVGLVMDWLGDNLQPVDQAVADSRALLCSDCPQNKPATITQWAYSKVADGLHMLMNVKSDLRLFTPHDDKLNACQACDCDLKLKVWCPINHVKNHTSVEVQKRLDPRCWVLK